MIEALQEQVPRLELCPSINVSFQLSGTQLPADHGYLVYSAISRSTPSLHGVDWLAIELVSGFPSGRGLIVLPERDATLRLRLPAGNYREVLPLAGKRLDIGGHQIRLGLPVARPLRPAPSLYARVVTIKKFTEAKPFFEAVQRKLHQFGITGRVELPLSEPPAVGGEPLGALAPNPKFETENSKLIRFRRRIVTIHGKSVVGFSVAVHDLSDEDSLLLQAGAVTYRDNGHIKWQSIFGRRAMGCGIFNPIVTLD